MNEPSSHQLRAACAVFLLPLTFLTSVLAADIPIAHTPTEARTVSGHYIAWDEHRIDDSEIGALELSGSDGLAMADLDGDGFQDIVSVHESDTEYDGQAIGHVRIAWGSADPKRWEVTNLAAGAEAAAAEDVSIADANGDGWPDIVVAAELAHLVYFQNPKTAQRTATWPRTIPPITTDRGSYIRCFFADFDGDGRPEVIAPNKGEQNPDIDNPRRLNVSIYHLPEDPMDGSAWREQVLAKVAIPINSEPVDLDGDGDLDVVAGSRGEGRIFWLENRGDFHFVDHPIRPEGIAAQIWLTGFNMDYADLNQDGRLDIVSTAAPGYAVVLYQPEDPAQPWPANIAGDLLPDLLVSVRLADIDSDGDLDIMSGAYSRGPRDADDPQRGAQEASGRIAWFENSGDGARFTRHDVSRRQRGMYDKWLHADLDDDGDLDFIGTRGNSEPYDGVIWLEQVRTPAPRIRFQGAREEDSKQYPLP